MKVLKLLNINLRLGWVLLIVIVNQQLALASVKRSGEEVVNNFLATLKHETLNDFNQRADKVLEILNCIEQIECPEYEILQQKYTEYRLYLGLVEFDDLSYRMKHMGAGYAVHSGVKAFFTQRTQVGKLEWNLIETIYQSDNKEKQRVLASSKIKENSKEHIKWSKQIHSGMRPFYKSFIAEYLDAYPFFGNLVSQSPSHEDWMRAVVKLGKSYEKVIKSIEDLEDEDRMELLGFTDAVEKTVDQFSEEENQIFVSYMTSKNKDTQTLGIFKKIISSMKLVALASCHITTFALAGVPNPVVQIARLSAGFVCSSIGLALTMKHFMKSTLDMIRQFQYSKTFTYSAEVWAQNIRSYIMTSLLAYLYVIPAVPGLVGRVDGIRKQSTLAKRAYRMKKLTLKPHRLLKFDRQTFLKDLKGLGTSYATYYGEELAIHSLIGMGGQYIGSLAAIESALLNGLQRSLLRPVRVFTYADMLKAI